MIAVIHSPACLGYGQPGHPESPRRVRDAGAALRRHNFEWLEPSTCEDADILRVHTAAHLEAVKTGHYFDADTPALSGMYEHARLSAGAAIQAANLAAAGRPAFSLMRPPGHHAERDRVMGFCYFNNIAIAVAHMLATGHPQSAVRRIAVLDFDCHHGNGTEDIFAGNDSVLFVSLHQSPCYPGTGLRSRGNIVNFPLPPGTGETEYLCAFDDALTAIRDFKPDLLAVSAGFDTHCDDPITQMNLDVESFRKIGERIRALDLRTFAILEGGYSDRFGDCVEAFVVGWQGSD